jgi:hypothetical protein
MNHRAASSRLAIVIAEQSPEAFTAPDRTSVATPIRLGGNQIIAEALMIALLMIMLQVWGKHHVERPFPQQEHLLEGFLFDRPNEPLGERVQIRTAWWQEERLYATLFEKRIECPCEVRVPVVEEIALA